MAHPAVSGDVRGPLGPVDDVGPSCVAGMHRCWAVGRNFREIIFRENRDVARFSAGILAETAGEQSRCKAGSGGVRQ